MTDQNAHRETATADAAPSALPRALVRTPLDPSRPAGGLPEHASRAAGVVEALRPLVHRGGLRADILTSGTIRVRDAVSA